MTLFRPLAEVDTDLRTWASADHARIPFGFPFVDQLIEGGGAEGEVAFVLAKSGVGKTAIGCNIALHDHTVPTVFFSLEMQARFILKRMAAIYSQTPDRDIERNLRAGGDPTALQVLVRDYPRLAIVDKPAMSLKDMGAALLEARDHWGVKPRRVIIDYLELVGGVTSLDGVGQVDKVSRKVKDLAREHDALVIVLHQLNMGGEAWKPVTLKDARYGGPTAADYVLAAYRPCLDPDLSHEAYKARQRDLRIQFLKTRGGPDIHHQGVQHDFDPETLKVEPLRPLPFPIPQPEQQEAF